VTDVLLAVASGTAVGLALGLTGGGGSIFAMPLLIYVLGLPPDRAVPISLAAVALTALMGAVLAARDKLPVWPAAVTFGLGGIIGAPAGIVLARGLDDRIVVGGFAALASIVGFLMWWRSFRYPAEATAVRARPADKDPTGACRLADDGKLRFSAPCGMVLSLSGLGTGILSGVFGVGGGFVIVPVLGAVTQMGIHRAVATSLVALSAIGLAGAGSAILQGDLLWPVLLPFVAGGAAGMLLGRTLATRLTGPLLQRIFATGILLVAAFMAINASTLIPT
jgi:uncharacterized membrane protein YfcA